MRIKSVTPVTYNWPPILEKERPKSSKPKPDTKIDYYVLKKGPESIDTEYETEMALPFALQEYLKAEEDGYDALAIDCASDGGLHGAKERLTIPVAGSMEPAMHIAAMLGHKFSIVAPVQRVEPMYRRLAKIYGMENKLASVRGVGGTGKLLIEVVTDLQRFRELLLEQAKLAVEEDGADVIILGCTMMFGANQWIQEKLGVPVINAGDVAIRMAEMFVDLKLAQSKRAFPLPPLDKKITF